jgi:hypothetical protein
MDNIKGRDSDGIKIHRKIREQYRRKEGKENEMSREENETITMAHGNKWTLMN